MEWRPVIKHTVDRIIVQRMASISWPVWRGCPTNNMGVQIAFVPIFWWQHLGITMYARVYSGLKQLHPRMLLPMVSFGILVSVQTDMYWKIRPAYQLACSPHFLYATNPTRMTN